MDSAQFRCQAPVTGACARHPFQQRATPRVGELRQSPQYFYPLMPSFVEYPRLRHLPPEYINAGQPHFQLRLKKAHMWLEVPAYRYLIRRELNIVDLIGMAIRRVETALFVTRHTA